MDLINLISGTPLPTILVVGGMLFIALALGSQIGGKIEMPAERQRMAGILGGALLIVGLAFYFLPIVISRAGASPQTTSSVAGSSAEGQSDAGGSNLSNREGCFGAYFAAIPDDRLASLETGAQDQVVINASQTKAEPFAILLTRDRQVVGGMIVNFFLESELFKLSSVVNAECVVVTTYENDYGDDPKTLGNWTDLELQLSDLRYVFNFDFSSGEIKGNFEFVAE